MSKTKSKSWFSVSALIGLASIACGALSLAAPRWDGDAASYFVAFALVALGVWAVRGAK